MGNVIDFQKFLNEKRKNRGGIDSRLRNQINSILEKDNFNDIITDMIPEGGFQLNFEVHTIDEAMEAYNKQSEELEEYSMSDIAKVLQGIANNDSDPTYLFSDKEQIISLSDSEIVRFFDHMISLHQLDLLNNFSDEELFNFMMEYFSADLKYDKLPQDQKMIFNYMRVSNITRLINS